MTGRESAGGKLVNILNYGIVGLFVLSIIIPFINVISTSLSKEVEIIKSNYLIWPMGFTIDGYKEIFKTSILYQAIWNSLKVVLIGVPIATICTTVVAYLLTCEKLYGRRILAHLLTFALLFYPGVVPLYILYKKLGMLNHLSVLIIPFFIIPYFLVYVKNYFYTIPASLHESATIDGAGELTILFRIIIPLVKPIMAILVLWYTVDYWSLYFYPLSFITDLSKRTLQPILRDIVMGTDNPQIGVAGTEIFGRNVAMGVMLVSMLPILLLYPFLQKYLIQGILIGSVKE